MQDMQNMQNIHSMQNTSSTWSAVTGVLLHHRHKGTVELFHPSISLGVKSTVDLEQEKKFAEPDVIIATYQFLAETRRRRYHGGGWTPFPGAWFAAIYWLQTVMRKLANVCKDQRVKRYKICTISKICRICRICRIAENAECAESYFHKQWDRIKWRIECIYFSGFG